MDYDTDYADYGGFETPPEDYGGYDTDLEEEARQQMEWVARHDRWQNGERSEELEREFGGWPSGYWTPGFVGASGSNNIPLGQALRRPNPPVVPNALGPGAPYDGPHPVGAENPSVAQPAARGRGARGRGGGFMANNPSWRVRLPSSSPPPRTRLPRKHKSRPVDLSAKFDDARFADFRVLTDSGHFFQVKKTLLAVQSPFFAQLFRSEQTELLVPGVEAAVVRAFLLILYRGRLADVQPHAIAVLALAVDFEVGDLKHDLSEWLAANLQLADVFRLLRLVERHPEELRDLRAAVFEFARRNAAALVELPAFDAFVKEDPELLGKLFKAVAQLVPRPRRGCPSCGPSDDEDGPAGFGFA